MKNEITKFKNDLRNGKLICVDLINLDYETRTYYNKLVRRCIVLIHCTSNGYDLVKINYNNL